jgi:glycine cleavage system H protein
MTLTEDYLFNEGHMWCRILEDASYLIGISDHAQQSLGEIAYIELPDCGAAITQGEALGVIESVKVVNDLLAPISGTVIEVNETLPEQPTTVNTSPYGDGWMLRIRLEAPEQLHNLMNHDQYVAFIG